LDLYTDSGLKISLSLNLKFWIGRYLILSIFAKSIKKILRTSRDSSFNWIEIQALKSLNFLPRFNFVEQRLITVTPRAGRGLKEPSLDGEFFGTIPNNYKKNFKHMHYNSRFWILDSLKIIFHLHTKRNLKIILIQYVPVFFKFPSIGLLNELHDRGVKIIKIWPDSWNIDFWQKRILPVSHIGQLNIITDIPNNQFIKLDKANNYSWHPLPTKDFPYINFEKRENFIFYSGGISHEGLYKSRREYLEYLNDNGFVVNGVSYDRNKPIGRPVYEDYRNALANSRIGLNFNWKGDVDVITGRTWEIFSSGSLLLQSSSKILDGLFDEGVHYLAFSSKEDLLARLNFLSENPTYAETIASSGHLRYRELTDAENFWRNLIQR